MLVWVVRPTFAAIARHTSGEGACRSRVAAAARISVKSFEQFAARRAPAAVRVNLRVPFGIERAVDRVAEPFTALFARHTGCRQKRPQLEAGFVNLRFRGALADAEDGRDLRGAGILRRRGGRTPRAPLRQPRDGSLEVEPLDSAVSHRSGSRHRLLIEHRRRAARPGLAALQVIETPVHRQAIQPGSDRGVAAKFRELSIGQQKDFLQQILRVGPGAAHPPREVEQPRRMLPIELLESWHISFGHSARLDEVGLGRVALPRGHAELEDP